MEYLTLASSNEQTITVLIVESGRIQIEGCIFNRVKLDLSIKINQLKMLPKGLFINNSCELDHSTVLATIHESNAEFLAFINHTTFIFGDGIRIFGQPNSNAYISNCKFKNNYSRAIDTFNVSKVIVANSIFAENSYRIIIYLQSYCVEINNCTINSNLFCEDVISTDTNYLNITNSLFIDNYQDTVFNYEPYTEEDPGLIHIKDSTFINNHGGGITNAEYSRLATGH